MYPAPARHPAAAGSGGSAGSSSGGLKFTVADTCERIKEEFNFIQQQYHSLKLECEKLASEKTEMQRHYVMYYEMSYGLNVEMHKQTEIAKRLNAIIAQLLPFLAQEHGLQHQQQVASAVDRAKTVTMTELNAIIGQQQQQGLQQLLQQIHAQQLPHGAVVGGLPPSGLLGFGAAAAAAAAAAAGLPPHLSSPSAHAAAASQAAAAQALLKAPHEHARSSSSSQEPPHRSSSSGTPESGGRKSSSAVTEERVSSRCPTGGGSMSPPEKFRTRTPEVELESKRRKEEKITAHDSDGEKSDQDLVVDVANEKTISPQANGEHSDPRENGSLDKLCTTPSLYPSSVSGISLKDNRPPSRSGSSSARSTPSLKSKDVDKSPMGSSGPVQRVSSRSCTPTTGPSTPGRVSLPGSLQLTPGSSPRGPERTTSLDSVGSDRPPPLGGGLIRP